MPCRVKPFDFVRLYGDARGRVGEKMSEAQAAELLSQKALLGREAFEVAKQICGVVERPEPQEDEP